MEHTLLMAIPSLTLAGACIAAYFISKSRTKLVPIPIKRK